MDLVMNTKKLLQKQLKLTLKFMKSMQVMLLEKLTVLFIIRLLITIREKCAFKATYSK